MLFRSFNNINFQSENLFAIIDTTSNTLSSTTLGANPETDYRWAASATINTKIYCIPALSVFNPTGNRFGIINTTSNSLTMTTLGVNPETNYSWITVAVSGTKIYCVPSLNSGGNQFGIINTTTNTLTLTTLGANPGINYSWFTSAAVI